MPIQTDKISQSAMSLALNETLAMPDNRNLIDLPQELLVIILKFHFEQIKVEIVYVRRGQRRNTRTTTSFLSAMLSCKAPCQIAQRQFFRHVELAINEMNWCSEHMDKPPWQHMYSMSVPMPVPAPFGSIRHVASTVEGFLPLLEAE